MALSIVAPAHIHEADADHGRSEVHRHVQPHSLASHDDDHVEITNDEKPIVWLDNSALYESGYKFPAPGLTTVERFDLVPALLEWARQPDYDTAPAHGPPRACLSLRAPPFLPA